MLSFFGRWLLRGLALLLSAHVAAASLVAAEAPSAQALDLAKSARALAAREQFGEAIELGQRALALAHRQYGARHEYVAYIVDDLASWHYRQQDYEEAIRLATQASEIIREARGPDSVELATLLNNLASIYSGNGQLQPAAALYDESHTMFLKAFGPNHERTAQTARNLGVTYVELSRFNEAQKYFAEALSANRSLYGENSVATARAYLDLAGTYLRLEREEDAAKLVGTARRILASERPGNSKDVLAADVQLAQIDIRESKLSAAKERLDNALGSLSASVDGDALTRASILYNLGWIHILRRQAVEAEHVYKEVLPLYRRVVSPNHPAIARTLHSLAIIYQDLGQYDQAEHFYKQAIGIFTASFGDADASVAATRLEYSSLLTERDRPNAGIQEAQAALSIYGRLKGQWDLQRGYAYSVLGLAQHKAGNLNAAAQAYARAIELITRVRGQYSSDLPPSLTDLGRIHRAKGRLTEAERVLAKAIAIREKDVAATPGGLAESLSELVNVRMAQGKSAEALALSRRIVAITENRLELAQDSLSATALGEQRQARGLFEQFVEVARNNRSVDNGLTTAMFRVAQFPHLTGTAAAVSNMAARLATGDSRLAQLIRERQDAIDRWRALDRTLVEGLAQRPGDVPAGGKDEEVRREMADLASRIETIDGRLRDEFPRYAELTNPRPVPARTVESLLHADEALLLQLTSSKATYLFLVRPDRTTFARTELSSRQLDQAVYSIRKGLDLRNAANLSDPPPFDTAAAHLLYQRLLMPFQQELKDVNHIVAVLDRGMQNLPLSILVATPVGASPKRFEDFAGIDFLGRHFAFSVEPSVSAFSVLRSLSKSSRAGQPFVGFGDPELRGSNAPVRAALLERMTTQIDPTLLSAELAPLPETRGELTALARTLKARESDLYFGPRASEALIKETDLSGYRIVAFATHGLLAGEFRGLAEPALVLTPPPKASSRDDGLLMASEIATLRLNADWVVLSACNTAAPADRAGAEGLSGLAKAFFYAGSRALLVSHWWVASDATVLLTTGAIQVLAENPGIGRAEALRRAMLPLMDGKRQPEFAHPAFWGPFVNVGEGGRVQ